MSGSLECGLVIIEKNVTSLVNITFSSICDTTKAKPEKSTKGDSLLKLEAGF
jgi:hypothetical protein